MDATRLLLLGGLLLLAACHSDPEAEARSEAENQAMAAAAANIAAPAVDPAELQARAVTALAGLVPDPKSAAYQNLRPGVGGAMCGEVEGKKGGGFLPFVVTPDGVAMVSATPAISFGDPQDMFPDFYIRWCASPEELATIGPKLREAPPAAPPVANGVDAGLEPDLQLPPTPIPASPPAAQPAKPAPPPPPAKLDDFMNSVARSAPAPKQP